MQSMMKQAAPVGFDFCYFEVKSVRIIEVKGLSMCLIVLLYTIPDEFNPTNRD